MPLLFSYGTLQEAEVQLAAFGRRLSGQRDELTGYARAKVRIDDPATAAALGRTHHENVVPSDEKSRVSGTALDVTDAELVQADAYEAPYRYSRVNVQLASGREAWLYVHVADSRTGR
jgi:gamma-glutamylcyclotransferase (GGCT)/AIG2-like uncharacterized protein YtfP